jgi:hypothetical protein
MGLIPCLQCRRHVRAQATGCPFCGALVGLATAATLVLAGCGGTTKTATPPAPEPAVTADAGVVATPGDAAETPAPPEDREPQVQPLYGIDFER